MVSIVRPGAAAKNRKDRLAHGSEDQVAGAFQVTFIDRVPPDQIGWLLTPTNRAYYDAWVSDTLPPIAHAATRHAWTVMTISENLGEADWRERVIHKIVADHRGSIPSVAPDQAAAIARNAITGCYIPRIYRVSPRGVMTSFGVMDTPSLLPKMMGLIERTTKPYKLERKTVCDGYEDSTWMWTSEGRQLWGENVVIADNDRPSSWAELMAYYLEAVAVHDEERIGINTFVATTALYDTFIHYFGANLWTWKVKALFDPGGNSEGIMMPTGPISGFRRAWPALHSYENS